MLLKQKAQSAWIKNLFDKKDHEQWLNNLLEKNEITSEQHGFIKGLLEKREESDSTAEWWKNIFEGKHNGKKPYWAKDDESSDLNMEWKWSINHKKELEQKAEARVEAKSESEDSKELTEESNEQPKYATGFVPATEELESLIKTTSLII